MNYKMLLIILLLNLKRLAFDNLTKECEDLQNKNEVLKRENSILKEKVEDLEKSSAKCVDEKEKLDAMLEK